MELGKNRFCVPVKAVTFLLFCFLLGCKDVKKSDTLFTKLSESYTGIRFANNVSYNEDFNPYTFRNFYNGGGVAIGDINNDGLPDIFFCSNQGSNKLYLNKGNLKFEDITDNAGLATNGVWCTGATMADINGDGYLDIYVCKSGDINSNNRNNELYINNKNLSFTPKAKEYGLDSRGLSTYAAFFDYDNDGDLDCYLLNNSFKSVGNYDLVKDQRTKPDSLGGNKLFRNDGNHFTNVTSAAGIYSSNIGFGLGVTISDVNKDGYQDIYVSNDFFEKDYLYINNRNGSFTECAEKYIREMSMNSMGADIADINNDGYPEIYVTDMLPQQEERIKTKTTFENWDKYQSNIQNGYYKQFIRNTLQLNRGRANDSNDVYFSEIGRYAGVYATDWSWGALIADLDNDGFKDIFVANGIAKDITDQDYIQYTNDAYTDIRQQILNKEKKVITRLIDKIPSHPLSNYAFSNNGNLTFSDSAKAWGLDEPSFSNGSAYGDLDGDGDVDLVVNNVNMPCFVYRNEASQQRSLNKYLKLSLEGNGTNRFGIGGKVTVYHNGTLSYQELMPMRGFESTVDCCLNFGLGNCPAIDSVVINWASGAVSVERNVKPNQHLKVKETTAAKNSAGANVANHQNPVFKAASDNLGIDFTHIENPFIDFDRDRLSFQMLSTLGPRMAKGDIDGDGLDDVYICGAKDQAGVLYKQTAAGRFVRTNEALFDFDKISEDTDALFFDCDGDGDQDLYVCSGGSEFSPNSTALIDRLYINDGYGHFAKSPQVLPSYLFESSSCVRASDFDNDGDQDLFVGVRSKPFNYGFPCKGYLLQNNGKGTFSDVTSKAAPAFTELGMVTDAQWFDYDRDGKPDLAVTGEYMPVKIFRNNNGTLTDNTSAAGLQATNGWWNRLIVADINGDGYPDLVGANHGVNTKFTCNAKKPVNMYVGDFDSNGSIEQIITCYNGGKAYPMALRHDLVGTLPFLKKKYLRYADYQGQTINEIFTPQQLAASIKLEAFEMRSAVFLNSQKGGFVIKPLPAEAQFSPMYAVTVTDADGDGKQDILMGGNFYESKPETGIYDGSYGVVLKGDGNGSFNVLNEKLSGLHLNGAVRDVIQLNSAKKKYLLWSANNNRLQLIKQQNN